MHTKGYLEIDKNTNKVHSFICVNTLLDEEEGKRRVEYMKNKFSVIINTQIPQSSDDVPASENPQQLEKAVLCLIQNLKSVSDDDGDTEASLSNSVTTHGSHHHYSAQHHGANPYFSGSSTQVIAGGMSHAGSSSKTPPLALVPPAADSIKNSITKSVSVVKTTAAKFLRSQSNCQPQAANMHENHSQNTDEGSHIGCLDNESDNILPTHHADRDEYATHRDQETERHTFTTTGAVKRKISCSISDIDSDEYRVPMQRQGTFWFYIFNNNFRKLIYFKTFCSHRKCAI